jgi:hypothetical protein
MVWFHGGKHEIEDATPECTAARTLTETTEFKVSETNLRLLRTESSGENKRYVYIARIRPGSIPNATSTSRAVWATWKEIISARRTGYLVRGDQHFPLRYETLGKPIDGWMNKTRGQCFFDPTRVYKQVWNEFVRVGRPLKRTPMPYFGGLWRFGKFLQG